MNVLIVDDHPLIRSGIRAVLLRQDGRGRVSEARGLAEGLRLLRDTAPPDVILLDLNLPDSAGLATVDAIREAAPETPVVVLSADDRRRTVLGALDRGAVGFIPKTMDPEMIWAALATVLGGGIYLPPEVIRTGAEPASPANPPDDGRQSTAESLARLGLTARQMDTLRMLVQGYPNKAIARELGITEATVKAHVSAILRTMDLASRTQIVIWLAGRGAGIADLRATGRVVPEHRARTVRSPG